MSNTPPPIPSNAPRQIRLEDLLLDPENPRLPESIARDQQSMLNYLTETTSIEELMDAIAKNDFFPGEPLIAVAGKDELLGKYIVVEGNRRLTAVKLLSNPNLASRVGTRMKEISSGPGFKPDVLPVIVRPNRDDVLPYLGFRHITGVKQWEPLAKAKYIEQLFNSLSIDTNAKVRYTEIAKTIGSRANHIKRNLDALAVYKVISNHSFYDIEDLNDETIKFAVLSTALADERIGVFTGVQNKVDDNVMPNDPILNQSCLKLINIKELTEWLYRKDAKGSTKVGESRNLRQLGAIVDSPAALIAIRNGASLKIAYLKTSNQDVDFMTLLYDAEAALTEAASMVATVSYAEEAIEVAKRVRDNIVLIGKAIKDKKGPTDEF
jgi:ParB-like nuclease domain